MELKSVNGANYQVIIKLLQRDGWGAQFVANEALEQGFSSNLIQYVANSNLISFTVDDLIENLIEDVLEEWGRK